MNMPPPFKSDVVAYTSFLQMEDQVIVAEMKVRHASPESHICLGYSVLVTNPRLYMVVDHGCIWLQIMVVGNQLRIMVVDHMVEAERLATDHGYIWLQIVGVDCVLQIV